MPVQPATANGRPGYRWGRSGRVFTYQPGSEASRRAAHAQAAAQGRATRAAELAREDASGGPRAIRYPHTLDELYQRTLRGRIRAVQRAAMGEINPILARMESAERRAAAARTDSRIDDLLHIEAILQATYDTWITVSTTGAEGLYYVATSIDEWVTGGVDRAVSRVLGIPFASGGLAEAQIAEWVSTNVQAITGLGVDALDDLQMLVSDTLATGKPTKVLRDEIMDRWDVSYSQASFYARDQTAKVVSAVNQHRQTTLGVVEYQWSTSGDGRVRQEHAALDGSIQKWAEPPVADLRGTRGHPGEVWQCRCVAQPVFDDADKARLIAEAEARKERELYILQESPTVKGEITNRSGFSDWNAKRLAALKAGDPAAVGLGPSTK